MNISYAKTVYGEKEIAAVVKCLKESTQMGKYSREFEAKVAKLFDKQHGIYVNSGSSALLIAMESFGFPVGSEVITPALTFSTTVGSIIKAGLIPVFVDVGVNDYVIDPEKIESMVSNKTVAILAPNLLGNLCQWQSISDITKKYNLKIIEDSADTLGATLNDYSSGHWSDISITSFYGSHIINCAGNGGMLCVNDPALLKTSKLLRSWGRNSSIFDERSETIENRFNVDIDGIEYDAKFLFSKIGYNLEGSEIGAAFGLVQLEYLEKNILMREENFKKQNKFFEKFPEYFVTPMQTKGTRTAWLAYPILIKPEAPFSRKELQIFLEKKQIQTRVIFTGNITRQPGFKNIAMRKTADGYPNADNVMRSGILLACHHGLNDKMLNYLHETIETFLTSVR